MITSAVFATGVGVNQGVREHYLIGSALLTVGLLGTGTFAFLIVVGAYLGVVRPSSPLSGGPRRALDAGVAGCVAALVGLGSRNWLWWAAGTTGPTPATPSWRCWSLARWRLRAARPSPSSRSSARTGAT